MTTCGNCGTTVDTSEHFNACVTCRQYLCDPCERVESDKRKCCANAGVFPVRGKRVSVAVLSKGDMLGMFVMSDAGTRARTFMVDPRNDMIQMRLFGSGASARAAMREGLAASTANGWQIGYEGMPLHG